LNFARRIAVGATLAAAVPLLFALLISLRQRETASRTRTAVSNGQRALMRTAYLERLVLDMESAVRVFRTSGQEGFLEPYRSALGEYGPALAELERLLPSSPEKRLLEQIRSQVRAWRDGWAEPRIAHTRQNPPGRPEGQVLLAEMPAELQAEAGKRRMDAIRRLFDALSRLERERVAAALASRDAAEARLSRLLWVAAAGFSILVIAAATVLLRSAQRRTRLLFEGIESAERGDYRPVAIPGKDEPARVAAALNRMVEEVERRDEELRQALESQRALTEEVRRTEAFLRSIIENIPNMIFVKDARDLRFVRLNRAGEELLGLSREEWMGKNDYDFFPKDQADFSVAKDREVLEGRKVVDIPEEPIQTRHQGQRLLHTKKIPILDEERKPLYLLGISEDITERRIAEEEILRLNDILLRRVEELKLVNQELEAFSYSVSHDLRAPLRHIAGFAQLLDRSASGALDEKDRRYLKTISESASRMGRLIDDLLAFSRIGRAEMNVTRVDLRELVEDVRRELGAELAGREVTWTVNGLPQVRGDPDLLRLVLANLLSNAVKYTSTRPRAEIEIGSYPEPDQTVFFVRDNGVGFDMRYAGKLFGVFQRLHRSEDFEGTGIGLANVRRIVQRHGGRTWAEASVDAGAVFYFSLPREENGAA
jgi:PAS domain S-box-containing protein